MSRRRRASNANWKRIQPDHKYGHRRIAKFINCMMWDGQKSIAENIVYSALEDAVQMLINEKVFLTAESSTTPGVAPVPRAVSLFERALDNVRPTMETKSRRVGGATYQIPHQVSPERGFALATGWIIDAARKTRQKKIKDSLCNIFKLSYQSTGAAVKKRDEVHRMADSNKAFAHYALQSG